MNCSFTREDTKIMKGIAIILMFVHHLWLFPDWMYAGGGLTSKLILFGEPITTYLGRFGNICVAIYFFLGGYGTYKSYLAGELDIVKKLKELYRIYWKVLFIFIPIGFLFFRNQPAYCENVDVYTRFSSFSWKEFIANFLGISGSYQGAWWFLFPYVLAVLTFPLYRRLFSRLSGAGGLAAVILLCILESNVFPALGQLQSLGTMANNKLYGFLFCQTSPRTANFWMGIYVAKEDGLVRAWEALKKNDLLNPLVDVCVLAAISYLYCEAYGEELTIFYVPAMIIYSLDLLSHMRWVRYILRRIGEQSTNMWLNHEFFAFYFMPFAKLTAASGNAVVALITLLLEAYAGGMITDFVWKSVGKCKKVLIRCVQE